ncbi:MULTISPECIES: response regulator [unclassified Aureispira]|uniref:response regulator n=1 Tax=unclassified Aureispira TaxID=2649989 RepID=UPI0006984DB9|nr:MULTISPECIES: response regulator [unclassified Aureispira]WMX14075.1 response regulator [Aureispira sp. CCB-E]
MSQQQKPILYKEPDRKLLQSICLYGLGIIFVRLVTNLYISMSWLPIVADVIMGTTAIGIYFLLKKIENFTFLFWPVVLITQISSVFLWFGMGGLLGPTIAFNLALLMIYIVTDPNNQYWRVGVVVGLFTLVTIAVEQLNPTWVASYPSFKHQAIDTCIVFVAMIVLVTLTTRFMKKRYEEEQELADKKTKELALAKKSAEENRDLLAMIKEFQSGFLLEEQAEYSFDTLLKQLLAITSSQYGFIAELIHKEDQIALEALTVMDTKGALEQGDLLHDTNWQKNGQSILKPLLDKILKEETYILSDKIPQKYLELKHFLGFPITHNNKIVGILGLSNVIGYKDLLAETLAPFLSTYGTIIQNIRLKRTQRKYEEELRKAKETAEEAVLAKNRLFTNISHEFRTPLSLIVGPVSAILKQPHGSMEETETRESLDMVLRNSKKVLKYIDDIMDLAKLNSNKLEVRRQTNHLHSFIVNIYNNFKVQTSYRNINYQLEYNVDYNLLVDFDTSKMEKIINNLLSNAFKYTMDDGAITLAVTDVGTAIKVEVKDTGIGIKAEDLPYVFKRFYQTKEAEKRAVSGSGVGLALAQELASLQGFEIYVRSILNEGTTFSFLMPKIEEIVSQPTVVPVNPLVIENNLLEETKDVKEGTSVVSPSPKSDQPRILVVEDNNDMAAFIKMILGADYDISLAENGLVALNLLKQEGGHSFDLVITDLMMPEMDGYELLEHIKAASWGNNLPVIVLTAKSGEASKLKALTIGVDEYLTKPFSVDELNIHVKRLIENALVRRDWQQKANETIEEKEDEKATSVTDTNTSVVEKESASSIAAREKIEEARAVVLKNIDETEFTVDDLARAVAVSKRQLYRFMQTHVGLTPLKFINEIRLQEARRLLEEGACRTVKEVSYSIGFMSTRHFSKNYVKRFGKKPSEYFK